MESIVREDLLPTILVVDDESSILRVLARVLGRQGMMVHTANSGVQGLLFLEKEQVDLVLSDQIMPGLTGAQLLAEVAHRWPDTERILMSGHCDPDIVAQGLRSEEIGCFLIKPLNAAAMRDIQERATGAYQRRINRPKAPPPR